MARTANFATNLIGKLIEEKQARDAHFGMFKTDTLAYFGLKDKTAEIDTVFITNDIVLVQVHDSEGNMAVVSLVNFKLCFA